MRNDAVMKSSLWRSPGEGKGYPLHYSGLEKSMDVHRAVKSRTWLSDFHFTSLHFTSLVVTMFQSQLSFSYTPQGLRINSSQDLLVSLIQ